MVGASLILCSCFSRTAQVSSFGNSLTAEYGKANDGSEYVDLRADVGVNSALVMPCIKFSREKDAIHAEATLTLVNEKVKSLVFPWRIPLTKEINKITFGPEKEVIWQREAGGK